ncbi:MAG: adenine deaminase [Eubacteriales bacterium]|nr:adenine deaminase [Eubacteriales bacterium]
MSILLKNGRVVDVFTDRIIQTNVLIEGKIVLGIGDQYETADQVVDLTGKFVCPGFIDAHFHIESSMLTMPELAKVDVLHGTTAIVADPHEIANVAGRDGIDYMIQSGWGLPMDFFYVIPSCVPATPFDESDAVMTADDIRPFYSLKRVLGLAEVMNYPGVLAKDPGLTAKIKDARDRRMVVNGHAPLLTGTELDRYIASGITDDHECSSEAEAKERIVKGQRVFIREGTSAKNLRELLPLFDEPWNRRCLLAADDLHAADLIENGHIDQMIRMAVAAGKSAVTGIRMATIQAAEYYGLRKYGAIAPGYRANLLILDDLDTVAIRNVYKNGRLVVENGKVLPFDLPHIEPRIQARIKSSFRLKELTPEDFHIRETGRICRVIKLIPRELLTEEWHTLINWDKNNGIDTDRDILKIAVIERHHDTGHIGLGLINGVGMKKGAIASSVSHDSHNLVVIGTNEEDMALVANHIRETGGGLAVACDGRILADLPLPVGGLMSSDSAYEVAAQNSRLREQVESLGLNEGIEPFMLMAFCCLTVIPHLKITTLGLVEVDKQEIVPLCVQ